MDGGRQRGLSRRIERRTQHTPEPDARHGVAGPARGPGVPQLVSRLREPVDQHRGQPGGDRRADRQLQRCGPDDRQENPQEQRPREGRRAGRPRQAIAAPEKRFVFSYHTHPQQFHLLPQRLLEAFGQRPGGLAQFLPRLGVVAEVGDAGAHAQTFGRVRFGHGDELLDDAHTRRRPQQPGRAVNPGARTPVICSAAPSPRSACAPDRRGCSSPRRVPGHRQDVPAGDVIHVRPAEGGHLRQQRQFAPKILDEGCPTLLVSPGP